jgi:hypothetical protein
VKWLRDRGRDAVAAKLLEGRTVAGERPHDDERQRRRGRRLRDPMQDIGAVRARQAQVDDREVDGGLPRRGTHRDDRGLDRAHDLHVVRVRLEQLAHRLGL